MTRIFLSYAREDVEPATVIYERLGAAGHTIFNWKAWENGGRRFIEATEDAIRKADYFVALVSPNFLASPWCREERDYALRREHERTGDLPFVHVLKIADVNPRDAGYFGNYDWGDAITPDEARATVDALNMRIAASERPSAGPKIPQSLSAAMDVPSGEPVFRNREDEVEKVLRGVTNAAGSHFWLVTGPPQLGKTWFLDRISKDQIFAESPGWVISRVDLRLQPSEVRADPEILLDLLFARERPAGGSDGADDDTYDTYAKPRKIAIEVIKSERPHICILDNAELLDASAVATLRRYLGLIYQRLLKSGKANMRLGVVVSSRHDDGWRGLSPDPRLSVLSLTEFKVGIVQRALRELAESDHRFSEADYWTWAALAHGLTEGLPALLARCLQWIVDEEWTDLDRMRERGIFRRLAGPYIEAELLTSASLFPGDSIQGDDQLAAVRYAYRLLVPYRLFTQSHLRHHLVRDPDLTDILGRLNWSVIDLWRAIGSTALLVREPIEPWKRIHPAVRRLLYRYFYELDSAADSPARTSPGGTEAHVEARRFMKNWAENQVGADQVVGMVECLWHDVNIYLPDGSEELMNSARRLSEDLRPSNAFTLDELRVYAVQLMRGDEEFQQTMSCVSGLFDRLVDIVQMP